MIAAGRTAESEIDAARVKRFERAELLGNHQRCMIWKHDPAGADPNFFSLTADIGDDDRGGRTGNTGQIMMLGQPITMVAPLFRVSGKISTIPECERCVTAFNNRAQIENGVAHPWPSWSSAKTQPM